MTIQAPIVYDTKTVTKVLPISRVFTAAELGTISAGTSRKFEMVVENFPIFLIFFLLLSLTCGDTVFGGNSMYIGGPGDRIETMVQQVKGYQIPAGVR